MLSVSSFANKFVLTHCMGKKLETSAYFYVGNSPIWKFDFRNGNSINYTIISFDDENNLLCGINAKDSNGDYCVICFGKNSNGSVKLSIKYIGYNALIYEGYYETF